MPYGPQKKHPLPPSLVASSEARSEAMLREEFVYGPVYGPVNTDP